VKFDPDKPQPKPNKTIEISVAESEVQKIRNRSDLERDSIESLLQVAVIEGNRQGIGLPELVEKVRKFWVDANDHSI
jgi:hypothetical protein